MGSRRTETGVAFHGFRRPFGVTRGVIPAAIPGLAERLDHLGAHRGIATGAALQSVSLLTLAIAQEATGMVLAAFAGGVGFGLVEGSGAVLSRELKHSTGRTLTGLMAITAAAALTPLVVLVAGHGLQYVLTAASVPHVHPARRVVKAMAVPIRTTGPLATASRAELRIAPDGTSGGWRTRTPGVPRLART